MSQPQPFASLEEEVSSIFVQRLHGQWTAADQAMLEQRLANDAAYAAAYRLAEDTASLLGAHGEMPEMIRFREGALAYARRSNLSRWSGSSAPRRRGWRVAAGLVGLLALSIVWQLSPWGYKPDEYRTGIGEQRMVELDDHSRLILDAATRVAIRYSDESRTIELIEGQAQFSVAKDPMRPFRVQVANRTIIALGTVFTVEFTGQKIHVAMMEGRVAIVPQSSSTAIPAHALEKAGSVAHEITATSGQASETIELSAGEELRVNEDGRAAVVPRADIEAATAWRNGKVVFKTERLADAIRRMNRYSSRVQLEIGDPALAEETISGVFEAGDTQGFIAGIQLALPVVASYRDSNKVLLQSQAAVPPEGR